MNNNRTDPPSETSGEAERMPRWVKVFGIIGLVLLVLFIVLQFIGGNHGPGRHLPSSSLREDQAVPGAGRR